MPEIIEAIAPVKKKRGRPSHKELMMRKPDVGLSVPASGAGFGTNTKWDDQTCVKSYDYINGGYVNFGDAIPSIEGLANALGVSRMTLYKWKDTKPAFREVMEAMETSHTRVTMNKACNGDIPSNLGMMLLSRQGYAAGGGVNAGGQSGVQIVVNFGHKQPETERVINGH